MRYDISKLPLQALLQPVSQAGAVLVRLDERIAGSPAGPGWTERMHFADACASLWVDGELVQLEDLVLHDAGHDVRAPTHALTIARDVLTARRRIAQPAWPRPHGRYGYSVVDIGDVALPILPSGGGSGGQGREGRRYRRRRT